MADPRFLVGLTMAARLTGKQRSTILRAIQSGRLSERRDGHNRRRVDIAELERVYGTLRTVADTSAAPRASEAVSVAPSASSGASGAELERLQAENDRLRSEVADWRNMYREKDQQHAKLAEQVATLQLTYAGTDQRTPKQHDEAPPKAKRRRQRQEREPERPRSATEELAGIVSSWLTRGR